VRKKSEVLEYETGGTLKLKARDSLGRRKPRHKNLRAKEKKAGESAKS
jgi:hypothetical protein